MLDHADLFGDFDPSLVQAIEDRYRADLQVAGEARAVRRHSAHQLRRAKAESDLAGLLPARFATGESWHVISHGNIDALSYLRHALTAVSHFDFVLLSTWCIATEDMVELQAWLDTGSIDELTLAVGELFPGQYAAEYTLALQLADTYGVRLIVSRNHSKVIVARHIADDYHLVMEGSANVNTNPRIEQTAIHCDRALADFYVDFYHGLRSIDKRPALPAG